MRTGCSHILMFLNSVLSYIETILLTSNDNLGKFPPIFIIGPPRSGSTLLYQVLTDYYDVGYLSNIHCRFWGAPSWLEYIFHPLRWRKQSDFTSSYGRTNGLTAPSECGAYWYRFFRKHPQYVPLNEADPKKMKRLRQSLNKLAQSFNRPVLFKNLFCSLRLQPIYKFIPESLFIFIKRDLEENALSLLNGRKSIHGRYDQWLSMEPPAIEKLKNMEPCQQVVEQVNHINSLIKNDSSKIGIDRFIEIEYSDFCNDVHGQLSRINCFLKSHEVKITKRASKIPNQFTEKEEFNISEELIQKVRDYADKT
jgi:hypothetical protein